MSTNGNGRSLGLLNNNLSDHSLNALSGGLHLSAGLRPRRSVDLRNANRKDFADDDSIRSAASVSSVDFERLNQAASQYDNRPDEARIWLKEFGNLKPKTNVSENLRVLKPQTVNTPEGSATSFPSLLPCLTRWLKMWFADTLAARKRQKISGSKSHPLKEHEQFHWLCQYIQDYLGLNHASLDLSDIQALCLQLFEICTVTSETRDIEDAVEILYASLDKWPYPPTILEQTLEVLARVQLYFHRHKTPTHLPDCIEILVKGPMRQDVMRILCAFVTPISIDGDEGLTQFRIARGTVLLLRGMINTTSSGGEFVLDYVQVFPALLRSASGRMMRLCADILDLCDDFVNEEPRLRNTMLQDWEILVRVLRECANPASSEESPSNKSQPTAHASSQLRPGEPVTDPTNTQYHLEAAHRVNESLSQLLTKLTDSKSILVYDYLMAFPKNLTDAQAIAALQYAGDRRILHPPNRTRNAQIELIIRAFVMADHFSSVTRSRAVEILGNSIDKEPFHTQTDRADGVSSDNAGLAQARIIEALSDQILVEKDPIVLHQLISVLQASSDSDEWAMRTIRDLERLITTSQAHGIYIERRLHVATQGLLKIFLKNMTCNPKLAIAAFESLVAASSLRCASSMARLSAMSLLFRLRCDSHGFIYILNELDSEYIAAALCRTQASSEEFENGHPVMQRGSASSASLFTSSGPVDPLWMYPDLDPLLEPIVGSPQKLVARGHLQTAGLGYNEIDVGLWLLSAIQCLQSDTDWETYSFIIVHLGTQLSNTDLFVGCLSTVVKLRQVLSDQVSKASFLEPPSSTGLKKHDVAICIFNILTPLISFATMKSEHIQKGFGDDLVRCFLTGVAQYYEGTSRGCIHALSICCLELPASVASSYPVIVDRMSKNMTQSHLTMHILEFLAQVARLPQVHSKFREDEITMIFSICIQFLEKAREQRTSSTASPTARLGAPSGRPMSGVSFIRPPYRAAMTQDLSLPQYVSALAYHTMIFWFLSLKLEIRAKYVQWIVPRLVWKNAKGEEIIDEQSQAFVDMMQRTAFSDLGETLPHPDFANSADGPVSSASWLVGMSVVTAETAGHTGITQITKRQASGTTYAMYKQFTAELPVHHAPSNTEILPESADTLPTEMLPSHILLQMVATAAPTSIADQPIPLPKEDFVTRALSSFDRIPTVDSHKIGILYIGPSQTTESAYLANTSGSPDYDAFLHSLGYPVSLKPPLRFNPMGLQYERDGKITIAWRDRVTEVIYHVPTLMPTNLEDDPQCVAKKALVGNDHVNIVFNNSGLPWNFDNFKSQLNYVNIVIMPANRPSTQHEADADTEKTSLSRTQQPGFYRVQTLVKPSFPTITPAADPKIISAAQLPQFVRLIALNADVYSQAWNAKESGDTEFPSNWRGRLQELKRLRERLLAKMNGGGMLATNVGAGQGRRTPVPVPVPVTGARDRDRETSEQNTDGALVERLDFSKWTL